jgi:RHS repeat-associated protein
MSQSKQSWLIRYHYDPLDQMTSHTVSDTPASLRFYRKNRLTTEIQGAVGYSIVQHDDLLLAQQQHQQNAHDSTLLATDLQRSPLHTLKKNAQPQPIAYSPYGHRSVVSALLSLSGFNGERQDPVTGHYILGNYRAFNPVLMRFNSPDSLSPFGKGGLNAYTYCKGDPINYTDPTGHFTFGRLLKNLGLKSTTYSGAHTSKWGVTKYRSGKAYEKIINLEQEIKDTVVKAQAETFNQDRIEALSLGSITNGATIKLQNIAYKALHSGSDAFQNSSDIARIYKRPYLPVMQKLAEAERREHISIFKKVRSFRGVPGNFKNAPSWLEFHGTHYFQDDAQFENYVQRIKSVNPEKVAEIRTEIDRLSRKYFKRR